VTKILVIEDELDVRENLQEILELEDFTVVVAANGKIGCNLAQQHMPDIIICDIMMPELDGYSVIKTIRADSIVKDAYFVFLSAKSTKEDREYGLQLGANDYITKPFTPKSIREAISRANNKLSPVTIRTNNSLDFSSYFLQKSHSQWCIN
jgi:two-component system, sensor histidine kinase and response regulator